ncbi:MAG: FAD-dependent oxidoreductase, partial [Acidobacteria bacterium]|nr:FAD-dependent oxidoreductase [Acidobacteriota bacterium]
LAKKGFSVTILEKNETVGGKVNLLEADGYKFDTGASLLTMRHILEELFTFAERRIEDYLETVSLEPICRYFWTDSTIFDASTDLQKTETEIEKIEPGDAKNFQRFLNDSRHKYRIAEKTFLAHSLNDLLRLLHPKFFRDLIAISSLKTLDAHNKKYFQSTKMRQLFNRFATYNGSSPFETPATFALIPFVEFGLGAWYVKGGMYEIPKALEKLARELGTEIKTNCAVEKILIERGKAAGVKKQFPQLAHHNIFFSDDYKAEFDAIFKQLRPAANPTVYVCVSSRTDKTQSPKECENLFVLINAPYTSSKTNWQIEADSIVKKLEDFGLENLEKSIEFEQIITPEDFEKKYATNKGSIYGVSSNGIFSAFLRPPNQSKDVKNLYFVGGATHPGGGIPLVLLSGKMASELISKKVKGESKR